MSPRLPLVQRQHTRGMTAVFVGLLAAIWGPAATAATGAIDVLALDADTRRAMSEVVVTVESRDGTTRQLSTGADGIASFPDLADGFYAVRANADGHVPVLEPSVQVVQPRTTALRIELSAAREVADVEEVKVTARAVQADRYGGVASGYFNRDELRNAVGAGSDVMRALDGLPGLASTGDFANFSVRGRGPRNNLILVDGFPFDKVVHFDQTLGEEEDVAGGGRYSIFAPDSITGAEFSPGGWSAAYGGRSGSLLQLDVAGGTPSPRASLRLDLAGYEAMYEGPSGLRDDTTLFVTARTLDFGEFFETIEELDIGQPENQDFILKTSTTLDEKNELEFLAIAAPESYDRNVKNVLASPDFEDTSIVDVEQDLFLTGLTWRRLVGDKGEWTNRFYLRDSDKTSSEGEAFPDLVAPDTPAEQVPVEEMLLTVTEKESEIGWRSDYRSTNKFGPFSAGLRATRIEADYATDLRQDWIRYVYRNTDPRPPGQDYIELTPSDIDSAFNATETYLAAYVEQVFEKDRFDWRAGLRLDRDGFADQSLISPRFSFNYRHSPRLRLSATAGLFYESPRFLVRGASPENFDIDNERITHLSAGLDYRLGDNWDILFDAYYQQLDDLVVDESRANGRVSNAGEGSNYGADIVLTRSFDNGWSSNMTYSYNRNRLDDNDGLGEYPAEFSRRHFFTLAARWEISSRWQLGARWKYGSGRPTDSFIVRPDVLGAGEPLRFSKELIDRNGDEVDDYHSLNLRVDYRRPVGPVDLVLFLDIINVYGGPEAGPREFNPRTGELVSGEDEALPLIGFILERAW